MILSRNAAGLPDIGELFSDSDEAHRGRDSAEFLAQAYEQVAAPGWRIANLDCVVAAEQPKISPHKLRIRERLAQILGVETSRINVKAKTGEGVGEIGREETVMAQCIVLLEHGS